MAKTVTTEDPGVTLAQVGEKLDQIIATLASLGSGGTPPTAKEPPTFGAITAPPDLLTKYADNPTLPETHDVPTALEYARHGYNHKGVRAISGPQMANEVYPFLSAQEVRIKDGSVPEDMRLPNGDAMYPEMYAFTYATGLAVLPKYRALSLGAGSKPTDYGPVSVSDFLTDQWASQTGGPSGDR